MQLDPLTGLPDKKPVAADAFSIAQALGKHQASLQTQQVSGISGDYGNMPITSEVDFNEMRALQQSIGGMALNATVQSLSKVLFGSIEAGALMLDVPKMAQALSDSQNDFEANFLAQGMAGIQTGIAEMFPIYMTRQGTGQGEGSRLTDASYWFSNLPSIASGLTFIVPGMGVAKGIGIAMKAAKASRAATEVATTLGTSLITRHGINLLESKDAYDQVYQKNLEATGDEMLAKQRASEAAAQAYRLGYLNIWQDIASWNILMRGVNPNNTGFLRSFGETLSGSADDTMKAFGQAVLKNPGLSSKTLATKAGLQWQDVLKQGGLEIIDENLQQFTKNLAIHNADISAGLAEGKRYDGIEGVLDAAFSGKGSEYLKSNEFMDATIFAFLGGTVTQLGGSVIGRKALARQIADQSQRMQREIARTEHIATQMKAMNKAVLEGDQLTADTISDQLITDVFFRGKEDPSGQTAFKPVTAERNFEDVVDIFKSVERMTPEELTAVGLDESAIGSSKEIVRRLTLLEESYRRNSDKVWGTDIDDILAMYMTEQEYLNTMNKERAAKATEKVSTLLTNPTRVSTLNLMTPSQRAFSEARFEKNVLEKVKREFQNPNLGIALNASRIEKVQSIRNKVVESIDKRITELQQIEKDSTVKNEDGTDNDVLYKETSKLQKEAFEDKDLYEAKVQEQLIKYSLIEGDLLLNDLQDPNSQDAIKTAIEKGAEGLQNRVYKWFAQQDAPEGSFVKLDDEVFKVSYTDKDVKLKKHDRQLIPTGDAEISVSLKDFNEGAYMVFSPEIVYSPEEWTAKKEEFEKNLSDKKFEDAVRMLNTQIYSSNYMDSSIAKTMREAMEKHIDTIERHQELGQFVDNVVRELPDGPMRNFIDMKVQKRALDLVATFEKEVKYLEISIQRRKAGIDKVSQRINKIDRQIADLKAELKAEEERIAKAAELGQISKDKRSKPYVALRKLRDDIQAEIEYLEGLKQNREAIVKQLEIDIQVMEKLMQESPRDTLTLVIGDEIEKTFGTSRMLRAQALINNNVVGVTGLRKIQKNLHRQIEMIDENVEQLKKFVERINRILKVSDDAFDLVNTLKKEVEESEGDLGALKELKYKLANRITKAIQQDLANKDIWLLVREDLSKADITGFLEWDMVKAEIASFPEDLKKRSALIDEAVAIESTPEFTALLNARKELQYRLKNLANAVKSRVEDTGRDYKLRDEEDERNPKRYAENVFLRPWGFSGNVSGDVSEHNVDPNQRRYFRFIENTNIRDIKEPNLKIVDNNTIKNQLEEGEKDEDALFGILMSGDKYVTENGLISKFDKDRVIFTSMGTPSLVTKRIGDKSFEFASSIERLKNIYDLHNLSDEQARQYVEKRWKENQEEYIARREEWKANIRKRKNTRIEVYGKTKGVGVFGKTDQKLDVFAPIEELELAYAGSNEVMFSDKVPHEAKKNHVYAYHKKTGNVLELDRKNLSPLDVQQIVDVFAIYAKQFGANKKGARKIAVTDENGEETLHDFTHIIRQFVYSFQKPLTKSEDGKIEKSVAPTNVADQKTVMEFYYHVQNENGEAVPVNGGVVSFKYNETVINEKGEKVNRAKLEVIDVLGKDGSINPVLVNRLETHLPNIRHNIDLYSLGKDNRQAKQALTKNESSGFDYFYVSAGGVLSKRYDSYKQTLNERGILTTKLVPNQDFVRTMDGDTIKGEKAIRFHNQNLIFTKPKAKEDGGKETDMRSEAKAEPGAQKEEAVTVSEDNFVIGLDKDDALILVNKKKGTTLRISIGDEISIKKFDSENNPIEIEGGEKGLIKEINSHVSKKHTKIVENYIETDDPAKRKADYEAAISKIVNDSFSEEIVDAIVEGELEIVEDNKPEAERKDEKPTREKTVDKDLEKTDQFGDAPDFTFREAGKPIGIRAAKIIADKLHQKTGVDYVILGSEQIVSDPVIRGRYSVDEIRKVGGYFLKSRHQVIINGDILSREALFHEFSHPIIDTIEALDKSLFEKLHQEALDLKLDNIEEILERNYSEEQRPRERVVMTLGVLADRYDAANDKKSFMEKIKGFWNAFIDALRRIFNLPVKHDLSNLSPNTKLMDVVRMLMDDKQIPVIERREENAVAFMNRDITKETDAVDAMNTVFFHYLNNNKFKDLKHKIYDKSMSKEIGSELTLAVKNYFENVAPAKHPENAASYKWVVDNFDYLTQRQSEKIASYGFNLDVQQQDIDSVKSEESKDSASLISESALTISSKENARTSVKHLISGVQSSNMIPGFGIPRLIDFGATWNLLTNKLSSTRSVDHMITKLSIMPQPEVKLIVKRLGLDKNTNDMSDSEMLEALQFFQAFSNHYYEYSMTILNDDGTFTRIDSNENSSLKRIQMNWEKNANPNLPQFKFDESGRVVYDPEFFKKKYGSESYLRSKLPGPEGDIESDKKAREFLSDIGINLTATGLISTAEGGHQGSLFKDVQNLLKSILEGKTKNLFSREVSDMGGVRRQLLLFEYTNSPDHFENSHMSEGKTKYNVSLNSYMTLIMDDFNIPGQTMEEYFEKNPHHRGVQSVLFSNKYWNGDGTRNSKKLTMTIEEALKKEDDSDEFDKLTRHDKLILELSNFVNGESHPVIRPGDNSIERTLNIRIFEEDDVFKTSKNYFAKRIASYIDGEVKEFRKIVMNPPVNNAIRVKDNPSAHSIFTDLMSESMKNEFNAAVEKSRPLPETFIASLERNIENLIEGNAEQALEHLLNIGVIELKGERYKMNAFPHYLKRNEEYQEESTFTKQQVMKRIKHFLADRFAVNIEQTRFFSGHPVYYKDVDDFIKRMSAMVGTKKVSLIGDKVEEIIDTLYPGKRLYRTPDGDIVDDFQPGYQPVLKTAVFEDVKVRSKMAEAFSSQIGKASYGKESTLTESDAIAYMHPDAYREILVRASEWTRYHEAAYLFHEKGKTEMTWNGEKIQLSAETVVGPEGKPFVFNMLKPQHFGPLAEQGFVPGLYKLSVLPLIKGYESQFPVIAQVRKFMEDNDTGLITFGSANKTGMMLDGNKPQKLYDDNGNFNSSASVFQHTYWKYWGIQVETGNTPKNEVPSGTQFMKHLFNGLFDKGKPISEEAGQLAGKLQKIYDQRILNGMSSLIKKLGLKRITTGEYTVNDVSKMMDSIIDSARRRKADDNTISLLNELKTKFESSLGFDVVANRSSIENILMSMVDKEMISKKTTGASFIQAPSTLFEKASRVKGKDGVWQSGELKFYEEDGVMEVYLPNRFKGISIDEAGLIKLVGFRIPTSGLNTIEAIRIKGFLPSEAGDTVVLPSEIVEKAGSDFDVDKLNIYLANYKKVNDQIELVQFVTSPEELYEMNKRRTSKTKEEFLADFKPGDEYKWNSEAALENEMINVAAQIIALDSNRKSLLTPVGTDMIGDLRDFINGIRKITPVKSYTAAFSDMLKMNEIKERSIQSKQGTGIAALHVTDHVNGMRIGYKTFGDGLSIPRNVDGESIDLSQMKNAAGEDIPTLLNQMINMFVDGVKDPIGFDLNFTIDTAPEVLFMIRAGVPLKTIGLLMNHPAVREYTEASIIGKSKYSKKEAWQMRMDVEKKYGLRPKDGKLELVGAQSISQESLEKAVRKNLNEPLVLSEYIRIRNHASVLSEHINASRIDTIAGGKTTSELEMILRQIDKLKQNPGITNWEKLFEKGGYLYYHYNALKEAQKMMTPFFVHLKNPKVYSHYLKMIDHVSRNKTMDLDTKARILDRFKSDFIASSILHSKPKMFGISETVPLKDQERELLSGPNSVANMLSEAKGSSSNMLVRNLFPVFHRSKNSATEHLENGELHNIKMFNQRLDVFERNQIVDAWRSLFKENEPLARNLVKLAIIQSGLQRTPMSFSSIIPYEIFMEMAENGLSTQIDMEQFMIEFDFINYDLMMEKAKTKEDSFNPGSTYKEAGKWANFSRYVSFKKGVTKFNAEAKKKQGIQVFNDVPTIIKRKKHKDEEPSPFDSFPKTFESPIIRNMITSAVQFRYGFLKNTEWLVPSTESSTIQKQPVQNIDESVSKSIEDEIFEANQQYDPLERLNASIKCKSKARGNS